MYTLTLPKSLIRCPMKRLLLKCQSFGIKGYVLDWIRDYLFNRRQCVRVGTDKSDWSPVSSGIPQGSVVDPILFVIFINELPCGLESSAVMFADDTKVYTCNAEDQSNCQKLQSDLDN